MKKLFSNFKNTAGFTLVELMVTVIILGILTSLVLFDLNPLTQYSKAFDGQRKQDLTHIRTALDTYFNDNNCYPASIPFGQNSPWPSENNALMQKVPQDPSPYCDASGCYYYSYVSDTDPDSCSQWNILFARLADKSYQDMNNENTCYNMLKKICPSAPENLTYNFCLISGSVDCAKLNAASSSNDNENIPTSTPVPTSPSVPTPTTAPTPTNIPTPTPVCQCSITSWCYGRYHNISPCTIRDINGVCNDAGSGNGQFCDLQTCTPPSCP